MAETNKTFGTIVTALSYLDSIFSGVFNGRDVSSNISDEHVSMLKNLFSQKINDGETDLIEFDPYIKSTFECFAESKTDIVINYDNLDRRYVNIDIKHLLIHKIEKTLGGSKTVRDKSDMSNLLRRELFNVFNKITSLTLITTDYGSTSWTLSMIELLSIIKDTSIKEVKVLASNGRNDEYKNNSWITHLWVLSSLSLIDTYSKSNYKIVLQNKIGFQNKYHGFVITKIIV